MSRIEIRAGRDKLRRKRFYVVMVADNGQDLNVSEMLNSREACQVNIAAAIKCAAEGNIVDTTA